MTHCNSTLRYAQQTQLDWQIQDAAERQWDVEYIYIIIGIIAAIAAAAIHKKLRDGTDNSNNQDIPHPRGSMQIQVRKSRRKLQVRKGDKLRGRVRRGALPDNQKNQGI